MEPFYHQKKEITYLHNPTTNKQTLCPVHAMLAPPQSSSNIPGFCLLEVALTSDCLVQIPAPPLNLSSERLSFFP
jgi:hypothetical protein